jgi:GTP cyclohydrolase I
MDKPCSQNDDALLKTFDACYREVFTALGEEAEREGLHDTPKRVLKALREMTCGYAQDPVAILGTTFDEFADELVVLRNIHFVSLCEHHMLPFSGVAHVAYLPGERVVGLSKLARLVDCFARRFQIQERLTRQVAETLHATLRARASACVVVAHHSCMSCRGVQKEGTDMITSCLLGEVRDNTALRSEFFSLINLTSK